MARGKKPELTLLGMKELKCSRRTKELRAKLFKTVRTAVDENQDSLAGYAVVVWDDEGAAHIAATPGGPVSMGMIATYVFAQLQDFRSVDMNDRNVRPTVIT